MQTKPEETSVLLEQLFARLTDHRPPVVPQYMNTRQAAEYLGVSTQFLEIARCRGGGPRYIKLAQAVRYHRDDLDDYMLTHRKAHTAEVNHVA